MAKRAVVAMVDYDKLLMRAVLTDTENGQLRQLVTALTRERDGLKSQLNALFELIREGEAAARRVSGRPPRRGCRPMSKGAIRKGAGFAWMKLQAMPPLGDLEAL